MGGPPLDEPLDMGGPPLDRFIGGASSRSKRGGDILRVRTSLERELSNGDGGRRANVSFG